jgi:hypothetical protein
MTTKAIGQFGFTSWDETTIDGGDGSKLTLAAVSNTFTGDIEGESKLEYVMAYRNDESADFVGIERITSTIGDRSGSFMLKHIGTYEAGTVRCNWSVVPGAATGELIGLRGYGGFVWEGHDAKTTGYTLDYDFD